MPSGLGASTETPAPAQETKQTPPPATETKQTPPPALNASASLTADQEAEALMKALQG